jgi:hypothetical protein
MTINKGESNEFGENSVLLLVPPLRISDGFTRDWTRDRGGGKPAANGFDYDIGQVILS